VSREGKASANARAWGRAVIWLEAQMLHTAWDWSGFTPRQVEEVRAKLRACVTNMRAIAQLTPMQEAQLRDELIAVMTAHEQGEEPTDEQQ
jgi:hypothetical protein